MQQAGTAVYKLDDMDFGRRIAVERELERDESGPGGALRTASAVWDESGNFVLYPTMLGIKGTSIRKTSADGSDQHGDEQSRSSTGEGRISAISQSGALPRLACKERRYDIGDGCVCKPPTPGQGCTRSAAFLYGIQEAKVLHLRERRGVSLHFFILRS